ncbi:MAG TPA: S41 family peptidase [Stellaceae bacterium]|nr:S41 family peptidase [Stellaceae bacterium]
MIIQLRRSVAASLAAATLLVLAGCVAMPRQSAETSDVSDLALYRGVLDRVKSSYVEPVGEDKLVANSLKGMLTGLDPHSDYMTENEYQEMLDDNSGEFAGIGAELTREDGRPKVISPIDDTPAARAGIRSNDVILKINGKLTDGLSLKDVVDQLRGPAGSPVALTIGRRDEKPFDVNLTRAVIHVASVKSKLLPRRVGYARITTFAEKTQQELTAALDAMTRQAGGHLDGFVLDLRNDPGGLLDEAVRVAGDFVDGGTVVSTRGRDADDNHVYRAPPDGDRLKDVPIVVMINGASASASEIVAGALQDRHRATLLGTKSFGKGSVQTIIPLDGHGALRLTTARYYTPSGRSIQAEGIVPDAVVAAPKNQVSAEAEILHESDLRGALDAGGPGKSNRTAAAPAQAAADTGADQGSIDPSVIGTQQDYQLAQAVAKVLSLKEGSVARSQAPGSR